jgi:hypothetical protein
LNGLCLHGTDSEQSRLFKTFLLHFVPLNRDADRAKIKNIHLLPQPHEKKRETVLLIAYFTEVLPKPFTLISTKQFTPKNVNLRELILE